MYSDSFGAFVHVSTAWALGVALAACIAFESAAAAARLPAAFADRRADVAVVTVPSESC